MLKLIALFIVMLVTALPAMASNAQPGHSYWKFADYGVVLDFWRCDSDILCGRVHSIDPADPKLRDKAVKPLKKNSHEITDNDLLRFCGYTPVAFQVHPKQAGTETGGLGRWAGLIRVDRTNVMTPLQYGKRPVLIYTFNVEGQKQGQAIRVQISKTWLPPFIGKTYTLIRVDNPPPSCKMPADTRH